MLRLYQKRIKISIDYDTFFETFFRNKNVDFMGFARQEKNVPKTNVFDTLSFGGILLDFGQYY